MNKKIILCFRIKLTRAWNSIKRMSTINQAYKVKSDTIAPFLEKHIWQFSYDSRSQINIFYSSVVSRFSFKWNEIICFITNSNKRRINIVDHLCAPLTIPHRISKLYECWTGSSRHTYSCCIAVIVGYKVCGKEPSTVRTLSTSINNSRTGSLAYNQNKCSF